MKSKRTSVSTLLATLACTLIMSSAFAAKERGGGDICEDRIKVIRDDLKSWIMQGGPSGLTLPNGVSVKQYSDQMLAQIETAKISCVGPKDRNFPVTVNGTPKVCRFDQSNGGSITCDFMKFTATAESDQYVLIHHEFAGLAGIEQPNEDDSRYEVSNQLSGYLVDQVVKKLAVKPIEAAQEFHIATTGAIFTHVSTPEFGDGYRDPSGLIWASDLMSTRDQVHADLLCKAKGARLPTKAEFVQFAAYLGKGSPQGYSSATSDGKSFVIPGLVDVFVWSSSVYQNYGFCFNGYNGIVDVCDKTNNLDEYVRCVTR